MPEQNTGVVFIDKPPGITSFKALGKIKKTLNTGKVGHTGTLDKFASGLIVVLTEKLTRFNPYITALDKKYTAGIEFGKETDTLDPEGVIIKESAIPSLETIHEALTYFTGIIDQIPPLYSAVHVNGKRASERVRDGEKVVMKSRKIEIYENTIISYENGFLLLDVYCSKGTYIRSLARDLGRLCDSCAYVKTLRRTEVGNFNISRATPIDDFSIKDLINPYAFFNDFNFKKITIKSDVVQFILNGTAFSSDFTSEPEKLVLDESFICGMFTEERFFLGCLKYNNKKWKYAFLRPLSSFH